MDKINISNLIEVTKLSTKYQINTRILREKIQTDLHVVYNNGMFLVTPELIAFLSVWSDDVIYLEDIYKNPIEANRSELLKICQQHYQKVMNAWHQQYAELKQVRKI